LGQKEGKLGRQLHAEEQIVTKLGEAEVLAAKGTPIEAASMKSDRPDSVRLKNGSMIASNSDSRRPPILTRELQRPTRIAGGIAIESPSLLLTNRWVVSSTLAIIASLLNASS